ncbi:hypothetical protein PR048_002647 [Dryococelus australis]|uniref:Uncharacterized protein n=1 Tax=Dryococelus australis TaxID=614101 RepID=A0ABQ9IKS3_9NEOP|nr:hypothetical protein PR048_002647 [Dryococelus australis]
MSRYRRGMWVRGSQLSAGFEKSSSVRREPDRGAAVAQCVEHPIVGPRAKQRRLDYLPHAQANRVRFQAETLPYFRTWEWCRTMPLAGLLGYLPFSPPFHSGAAPYSPCFTLICFQDLDVKSPWRKNSAEERLQRKRACGDTRVKSRQLCDWVPRTPATFSRSEQSVRSSLPPSAHEQCLITEQTTFSLVLLPILRWRSEVLSTLALSECSVEVNDCLKGPLVQCCYTCYIPKRGRAQLSDETPFEGGPETALRRVQ